MELPRFPPSRSPSRRCSRHRRRLQQARAAAVPIEFSRLPLAASAARALSTRPPWVDRAPAPSNRTDAATNGHPPSSVFMIIATLSDQCPQRFACPHQPSAATPSTISPRRRCSDATLRCDIDRTRASVDKHAMLVMDCKAQRAWWAANASTSGA